MIQWDGFLLTSNTDSGGVKQIKPLV